MATTAASTAVNNPGNVLASAVDAEVKKFREIQEEVGKLRGNLQLLLSQRTESDMVQQEFSLLDDTNIVYKQVGPVLLQQDLDEAKQTVSKRLEYIDGEKKKLEGKIESLETEGNKLAVQVQKMQAQLQQTTADAVRAIAQQHQQQ